MRTEKHEVRLTEVEREALRKVVSSGCAPARKITRARILLKADAGGEAYKDGEIVQALKVGPRTVERVRKAFCRGGLAEALERRAQPPRPEKRRLDGAAEAHLIALACSSAPEGHERWTLDLLAERMVKLNFVPQVSRDTVRRVLKKTNSSLG